MSHWLRLLTVEESKPVLVNMDRVNKIERGPVGTKIWLADHNTLAFMIAVQETLEWLEHQLVDSRGAQK